MLCPVCAREQAAKSVRCADCDADLTGLPMQPLPLEALLGQTLRGYRIESFLGAGGMGSVFLATHARMQRKVALKVLPNDFANDPEMVERFRREARAVADLEHPAVVPVYDMFCERGLYCIAMAYIEGGSLRQLLRERGRLGQIEAARLIHQAALGLVAVARRGIVHRDIKPDNLLLGKDGVLRIADFGVARCRNTATLTQGGALIGTAKYMAPEQCRDGRLADHRSDLYALGCTLFELLTGRPPFAGPGTCNYIEQHLFQPPPDLRALRPDIAAEMAQLIARLLAKDPEERFAHGGELASALEAFLPGFVSAAALASAPHHTPTQPAGLRLPSPPPVRRPAARPVRFRWPLLLLLFAILAGVLVWLPPEQDPRWHSWQRALWGEPFEAEAFALEPAPSSLLPCPDASLTVVLRGRVGGRDAAELHEIRLAGRTLPLDEHGSFSLERVLAPGRHAVLLQLGGVTRSWELFIDPWLDAGEAHRQANELERAKQAYVQSLQLRQQAYARRSDRAAAAWDVLFLVFRLSSTLRQLGTREAAAGLLQGGLLLAPGLQRWPPGADREAAQSFCQGAIDSGRAFLRAFPGAPNARRELALALACRSALRTAAGDRTGAQQDADEVVELLEK